MKKKEILMLLFGLILLYPIFSIFQLDQALSLENELKTVEEKLRMYQISIWLSWLVLVIVSIYDKWSRKRNLFFTATYAFLFLTFSIFGLYTQMIINLYDIPSTFEDNYTLGIFTAVQNIVISVVLTGFLQAGVWWFTRRWHRR